MPSRFYPDLLAFFSGDSHRITGIPARLTPPYHSPLVPHPIASPREFLLMRFAEVLESHLLEVGDPESIEIGQELLCLIQEWMIQYGDPNFYQEADDNLPHQRIWKIVGRYCRLLGAIEHVRAITQTPLAFDALREPLQN